MRFPLFTSLALVTLVGILSMPFSRGTPVRDHAYRFHVEQRRSPDGTFELTYCPSEPAVRPGAWRYDHSRSLRASLYASSIVIETHSPKKCYLLSGPYHRVVRLGWVGPTSLGFADVSLQGREIPFVIDVITLAHEERMFVSQRFPSLSDRADAAD